MYFTDDEKQILELFGADPDKVVSDEVIEKLQEAEEHSEDETMKETLQMLLGKLYE